MPNGREAVVRLRHGLGVLVSLAAALAGLAWWSAVPPSDRLGVGVSGLGVVALVALFGALPLVRLDPSGVLVRNPLRQVRLAWPALREVGFGWCLTLAYEPGDGTGARTLRAFAAPGPARMTSLYERHVTAGGVLERDAATSSSPAPAVTAVLQAQQRWGHAIADGAADSGTETAWYWPGLGLLAFGVVALVSGLAMLGR